MTQRLDSYLQAEIEKLYGIKISRSYVERILEKGGVSFNDEIIKKKGFQVNPEKHVIVLNKEIIESYVSVYQTGKQQDTEANRWDASEIGIEVDEARVSKAGDIRKRIVYEDDNILVVNKPSGVSSHPGKRDRGADSMVYQFIKYMRDAHKFIPRAGLLHRLDKDTSGILVFAKNMQAYNEVKTQFEERTIKKYYIATCVVTPRLNNILKEQLDKYKNALVEQPPKENLEGLVSKILKEQQSVELNGYIFKRKSGISMVFTPDSKIASGKVGVKECSSSIYVISHKNSKLTLLFSPHTGRTHQIRAQLQFLGCPVVNDKIYGRSHTLKGTLGLTAVGIEFKVKEKQYSIFL